MTDSETDSGINEPDSTTRLTDIRKHKRPIKALTDMGSLRIKTRAALNRINPMTALTRPILRYVLLFVTALVFALHLYLLFLRFLPVPLTLNMMLSSDPLQRQSIHINDISPHIVTAVIAAEDTRFCQHTGIDFDAVKSAISDNQSDTNPNKRKRGGSTISQQTAKNIIFWNGGGYIRKAGEAYVTLFIEAFWPKRRIIDHYLNIADWGDGIYGIEAAASVRFGKSAQEINQAEAALLAAVLPSPHKWRLNPPGPYVAQRAKTIESRMGVVRRDGLHDCVFR